MIMKKIEIMKCYWLYFLDSNNNKLLFEMRFMNKTLNINYYLDYHYLDYLCYWY